MTKKTEILIYWGTQYSSSCGIAAAFKREHTDQGYLVICFNDFVNNAIPPNKGSKMKVTYFLGSDGLYHGTAIASTDPGAYD